MRKITLISWVAGVTLAGLVVYVQAASGQAGAEPGLIFVTKIPAGYRDWRFVSLAREEGSLDDIRVILGNDTAIKAYREGGDHSRMVPSSRVLPTATKLPRRTTRSLAVANPSSRVTPRTAFSSW